MEKVKIALVGVGNRGRYAHLLIITRMTDARKKYLLSRGGNIR